MSNQVIVTLSARDEASRVIDRVTSQLENGLTRSLGKATLGANLMTSAITKGLQGLGSLMGEVGAKLKESMNIQQQNISTAGTLMKLIGLDFNEATGFIDGFSDKMSKVAASLPGATSDYVNLGKGIMDNLVPAFKALDGSFDREGYSEALNSISKDAGFLAATSGVNTSLAGLGISKFLGGVSTASLQQLKFFEANPAILSFIEKEAQKLGKEIKDLTANERVKVLQAALKVPDEVIKASTTSISGLVEGFKSTLFDPQTGIFGLMKDLSDQAGTQSVYTALNDGLKNILGEDGLLSAVGKTLTVLGIEFGDPMVALRNGILAVNSRIRYLADVFNNFTGNTARLENDIKFLFNKIFNFKGIGEKLGQFFNQGIDTLGSLNWAAIFGVIGEKLADLINGISKFILAIDFGNIINNLPKVLWGMFVGLGKLLSNLDWGNLLQSVGKLLGIAFLGTVAVAGTLLVAPVIASIGTLGAALVAAFAGLISVVVANWDKVKIAASNVINSIAGLFTAIGRKFNELLSKVPLIGNRDAVQDANDYANNRITNGFSGFNNSGLLNAANRELRNSPPGAGLVMANSTESILNRSQQSKVMSALNSKPGLTIGAINIHTQATNAKEIAEDVVNYIGQSYQRYSQSHIVAPVS